MATTGEGFGLAVDGMGQGQRREPLEGSDGLYPRFGRLPGGLTDLTPHMF